MKEIAMATSSPKKMPQSAYHLYFRFYRNILQYPSLKMESIKLDETHLDLYKSYVKMVLDSDLDGLPFEKSVAGQSFLGNDSFVGMSKKVSRKWKEAGELTRSIFKELAKEDRERYNRVSRSANPDLIRIRLDLIAHYDGFLRNRTCLTLTDHTLESILPKYRHLFLVTRALSHRRKAFRLRLHPHTRKSRLTTVGNETERW